MSGDDISSVVEDRADRVGLPDTNRRYWARRLIDAAGGQRIPRYGSAGWAALPEGDPRRVAACVIAAESWAADGDDLEDRLRRELDNRWYADKSREDADYAADVEQHRERWAHLASVVPFAERRRRQLEDARPRPGDFAGVKHDQ